MSHIRTQNDSGRSKNNADGGRVRETKRKRLTEEKQEMRACINFPAAKL